MPAPAPAAASAVAAAAVADDATPLAADAFAAAASAAAALAAAVDGTVALAAAVAAAAVAHVHIAADAAAAAVMIAGTHYMRTLSVAALVKPSEAACDPAAGACGGSCDPAVAACGGSCDPAGELQGTCGLPAAAEGALGGKTGGCWESGSWHESACSWLRTAPAHEHHQQKTDSSACPPATGHASSITPERI